MKRVEVRVWIDRPVEEVYAYVADLDRWPEWRTDVVGGELLTEGPMRVGSRAQGGPPWSSGAGCPSTSR